MTTRATADQIRAVLKEAHSIEWKIAPFNLFGRGHEPRVVLDRTVAAIVRSAHLSRECIAGYGAKYRYSRRAFNRALHMLQQAGQDDAAEVLRRGFSNST